MMNTKFSRSARNLTLHSGFIVQQLLKRGTSKIAVEINPELARKLENDELKPRKHPGIVRKQHIVLPPHINTALQRIIGDIPVKSILKDGKQLNKYLAARHPPLEKGEMRKKIRDIKREYNEKFPLPENFEELKEEEKQRLLQKRQNAVGKKFAECTYAWKPTIYTGYEAIVYAITRGAHEYSVLLSILHELQSRDIKFQPHSYFDFGSGIGTGMWAASTLWEDAIFEYFNVDSSRDMNDLSELILQEGRDNQQKILRNVYYRQFLPSLDTKYDLVVSSYSLFELPNAQQRREVVKNLWEKCSGYLIIVEEGTRRGSELVNEARDLLLTLGDDNNKCHVLAPCPHDLPCPRLNNLTDRTPCNFEAAYKPLHIGEVKSERQIARYSYVIMKKGELQDETRDWPRLVRPTIQRSKHVICRMCTADANLQEIIFTKSKHGSSVYQCAKVTDWGHRLPISIGEKFDTETKHTKFLKQKAEIQKLNQSETENVREV
ncbi:methyltransferase-like protein 17, mitochondrial [Teleopsis dalmanni]|uniref:methyltransferase-like protein 17, mitochondrial n=1 Tax=Teleopsis dalmanni TaxID=139649 RepID=UPI0018CD1F5B|nr:methyltransferase-like protein 17, mitochondrial [Teleopsis dalmanni]